MATKSNEQKTRSQTKSKSASTAKKSTATKRKTPTKEPKQETLVEEQEKKEPWPESKGSKGEAGEAPQAPATETPKRREASSGKTSESREWEEGFRKGGDYYNELMEAEIRAYERGFRDGFRSGRQEVKEAGIERQPYKRWDRIREEARQGRRQEYEQQPQWQSNYQEAFGRGYGGRGEMEEAYEDLAKGSTEPDGQQRKEREPMSREERFDNPANYGVRQRHPAYHNREFSRRGEFSTEPWRERGMRRETGEFFRPSYPESERHFDRIRTPRRPYWDEY